MSESEMGNQQAKVSDLDYGWVAGFFDGEGSVLISIRAKAGKNLSPKVQPACKVQATDPESCERMQDILSRAEIGHHVTWVLPRGFTKAGIPWRRSWAISIVGLRRTQRFLEWITPALSTKRKRAALCLEYIRHRLAHSDPRTPLTDDEVDLVLAMREMNVSKKPVTLHINREAPGASSAQLAENGKKGAQARWGVRR